MLYLCYIFLKVERLFLRYFKQKKSPAFYSRAFVLSTSKRIYFQIRTEINHS